MATVAVKIRIMPKSLEIDLTEIEKNIRDLLKKNDVKESQFEVHPVAFGLKSLTVLFGWPEEKEFEEIEKKLQQIPGVSSLEVIDMRRAI